jgi:hypothetical protein
MDSALAAVAGLNDKTLDDVCYKCSISHNLEKQLMESGRHMGGNSPITPGTSSSIWKPAFAPAGSSPMNGSPAAIHGFPRAGSNGSKTRGGVSLLNPSSHENSSPSPMSWSPAPGFYNSHHQLYSSQQQVPTPSSTRPLIPPIQKNYHSMGLEEKRQQFIKQTSVSDDESFYSSMMEREFSGRIPIPANTPELNNAAASNNFRQSHSISSSAVGSQRGSPTSSILSTSGATQGFTPLGLPSSLNSLSSCMEGMSLLSTLSQQQQQQPSQQQPIFKFEHNPAPTVPSFVGSSLDTETLSCGGNGNIAFVAASAILGSGFPTQQSDATDLSCSVTSSGHYSLFSDCSGGSLTNDLSAPAGLFPPLGVPPHGFYDNLLNLSTSTDRTDVDRDSFGHQSLQNFPDEKPDSVWCAPNSFSGVNGLFEN